jgi:hypothetical protein
MLWHYAQRECCYRQILIQGKIKCEQIDQKYVQLTIICHFYNSNFLAHSDVLAWLWPQAIALAWLFLALASLFSGQSQAPWPWPGFGLAWLEPLAWDQNLA